MENCNIDKKALNRVAWVYGPIVALVNFMAYELANSGGVPFSETEEYEVWYQFMLNNSLMITIFSILSFVVPIFLVIRYRIIMVKKEPKRIINMPFAYSAYGSLGWIISFLVEYVCLLYVKYTQHINISEILIVSYLNILQESIYIFTLTFLILNFLHRKVVLPKLFPEGNLSRFTIRMKPSVRFIVIVFFFSICVFPVFFMTSSLVAIIRNNNLTIGPNMFMVLGFIMAFCIIILWAFCDYFTAPLNRLKIGIQKIKNGDFNHRVNIVSSDDFGELADAFNEMSSSLDEKNKKIQAIQDSVIKGMAVMVESRDNSTGGHISRTSDCVKVFADKLVQTEVGKTLTPEFYKAVIKAAPMHDLGKIAVDDMILRKPGKFTEDEYKIMKTHSAEGARIVEKVLTQVDDEEFKKIAINVAHYHHEKWDGSGYPEKLHGEEIPIEARIMALADVFDALVSKRCYKEKFTYDKAFQIIEESLGSHFDPELGQIFIQCREDLENLYKGYEM